MSMTAEERAALEAKRQEELRLEQVRGEASRLLGACESALEAVTDAAVLQAASAATAAARSAIEAARGRVKADPDEALRLAEEVDRELASGMATAVQAVKGWAEDRARYAEARASLSRRLEAVQGEKMTEGSSVVVAEKIRESQQLAEQGDFTGAGSLLTEAESQVEIVRQEVFDETVRKELVRSLKRSLKNLGFVVSKPRKMSDDDEEGGIVSLTGKLTTGEQAVFHITVDGRLRYDLDGYEGRACAGEMERVRSELNDNYGISLTPIQHLWKNPDRISKGSMDRPDGGTHRTAGGGA